MKYILFFLLIPAFGKGQLKTAEKTHKDSTGTYFIVYDFDSEFAMTPATSNAQPHYTAIISVYRVVGKKREQVGDEIQGTYVPDGCFEDVPAEWVKKAKATIKKK